MEVMATNSADVDTGKVRRAHRGGSVVHLDDSASVTVVDREQAALGSFGRPLSRSQQRARQCGVDEADVELAEPVELEDPCGWPRHQQRDIGRRRPPLELQAIEAAAHMAEAEAADEPLGDALPLEPRDRAVTRLRLLALIE